MSRSFGHYCVASYRDGSMPKEREGDITIHEDVTTYVYRSVDPDDHQAFFDWATSVFTERYDTPRRLVGSIGSGFRIDDDRFEPPPAPPEDSPEYQDYLDGPYQDALTAWTNQDRP
ncbi:MAG: hypothetical protein NTV19_00015 [Burkholderiales bacterium]|nr:hypothetical protein [Burkholderiales bacterium]